MNELFHSFFFFVKVRVIRASVHSFSSARDSAKAARMLLLWTVLALLGPVTLSGQSTSKEERVEASPQVQQYFQTAKQAEKAGDYEGAVKHTVT